MKGRGERQRGREIEIETDRHRESERSSDGRSGSYLTDEQKKTVEEVNSRQKIK